MKKLILLIAIALFSCNDKFDIKPIEQKGTVIFYNGNIREIATITINGFEIGRTTQKPLGYVPDINSDWAVHYTAHPGRFTYEAKNNEGGLIKTGTFVITEGTNTFVPINHE